MEIPVLLPVPSKRYCYRCGAVLVFEHFFHRRWKRAHYMLIERNIGHTNKSYAPCCIVTSCPQRKDNCTQLNAMKQSWMHIRAKFLLYCSLMNSMPGEIYLVLMRVCCCEECFSIMHVLEFSDTVWQRLWMSCRVSAFMYERNGTPTYGQILHWIDACRCRGISSLV